MMIMTTHGTEHGPRPPTPSNSRQQQITVYIALARQQGLPRVAVNDTLERWRQTLPTPRLSAKALRRRIATAYARVHDKPHDAIVAGVLKVFDGLPPRPKMIRLGERMDQLHGLLDGTGRASSVIKELVRPKLIAKLETLGVENAKKVIGAALKAGPPERADLNGHHQGQAITLRTIEPSADPVDGAPLLTALAATFETYLVLPKHAATALALGVVMSYTHDVQDTSPIIAVVSPTKRCGKTTLMLLAGLLVQRPLPSVNISPAALFRSIEAHHPTLLVDEADTAFKNDDLKAIYNAGHTRDEAHVLRTVGDDHEPRQFSTWSPKWLALIGKLPDTLEDRSIVLRMRRRAPGETLARARRAHLKQTLLPLAQQVARWAKDHLDQLKDANPPLPPALNDRAQDNWRPLVAIAEEAGGNWPTKARAAALALSRQLDDDDEGSGVTLLSDLQKMFKPDATGKPEKALPSAVIIKRLTGDEMTDGLWQEYRAGKEITPHQLAKLLKPFGVHAVKIRFASGPLQGYCYDDLKDAFTRYVPTCSSVPDFQGGYRGEKRRTRGQRKRPGRSSLRTQRAQQNGASR